MLFFCVSLTVGPDRHKDKCAWCEDTLTLQHIMYEWPRHPKHAVSSLITDSLANWSWEARLTKLDLGKPAGDRWPGPASRRSQLGAGIGAPPIDSNQIYVSIKLFFLIVGMRIARFCWSLAVAQELLPVKYEAVQWRLNEFKGPLTRPHGKFWLCAGSCYVSSRERSAANIFKSAHY